MRRRRSQTDGAEVDRAQTFVNPRYAVEMVFDPGVDHSSRAQRTRDELVGTASDASDAADAGLAGGGYRNSSKGTRLPQIGPLEILVVLVVALVVFGPSKLPQIGRQVGRGVRGLRKFQHGIRNDVEGAFGHHDDQPDHEDDDVGHDEPGPIDAQDGNLPAPHEPPPADTTS